MSDVVIEAEGLTRRFGDFTAVDHISFEIQAGEVVGYLGPNGSGKTTTIRMLLGLLIPSEGSARVLGYDVVHQAEQVRKRVGYMSQRFALYDDLTVGENLSFYAGVYGVKERACLDEALDQVGLRRLEKERVSSLSTGWRQRLALATAIVHRPQLLFLDEPTSGVDPTARRSFWELIYDLVAQGVTAMVTTHYMDEAEYCGRVGIMHNGRLLAMDVPSALKETALSGQVWDVFVDRVSAVGEKMSETAPPASSLLMALEVLERYPGVLRTSLVSDHLRAVTSAQVIVDEAKEALIQAGIYGARMEPAEPSLEDVFLALVSRGAK